jgi:hypothetical protein
MVPRALAVGAASVDRRPNARRRMLGSRVEQNKKETKGASKKKSLHALLFVPYRLVGSVQAPTNRFLAAQKRRITRRRQQHHTARLLNK